MDWSLTASATVFRLLAAIAFVVLVRPSPFAEGIECVQCGMEMEPCGQTLPPPTRCEGDKDVSCVFGVFFKKYSQHVQEARRCYEISAVQLSANIQGGMLEALMCQTDGCNSDRSGEQRPPAFDRPLPSPPPVTQCPPSGSGPPLRIECIQCGWNRVDPCGAQLPPATHCSKANDKRCFAGAHMDKLKGTVRETRGCTKEETDAFSYFTHDGNNVTLFAGSICKTAGCNYDTGRQPNTNVEECPSPLSSSSSSTFCPNGQQPKSLFSKTATHLSGALLGVSLVVVVIFK